MRKKLTVATMAIALIAGATSAASLDVSYLASSNSDALRTQVQASKDKTRFYTEVNVVDVSQSESRLTSRTILQYQLPLIHLHAQGTYAQSYKEAFVGVGINVANVGVNAGVNDAGDIVGLLHYAVKDSVYGITSSGHLDVKDDGAYKGRSDIMYPIGSFVKAGYELRYGKGDSAIHSAKIQIKF
jgi:hypothetical protein